jgi:hypothetical protein
VNDVFFKGRPRFGSIHTRTAIALIVGCMLTVAGCSGCSISASTGGGGGTTAAATATATTESTATTAPTATSTQAAAPTATPRPPLQSQVIVKNLGNSIGSNTNSSIVDATCPAGYLVAGGGVSSGYTTFNIMWNAPISTTTWRGEIFNYGGSAIAAQLQVVCLKVSGLVGQVVTKGMGSIGATTTSSIVDLSCPAGYLVAGGGINAGYGTLVTMSSAPINTTTWREEVYNTSGSAVSAQVQAECLKVSGLTGKLVITGLGNADAGTNSLIKDTACPAGYLVAGGGITSGYETQTVMQSEPINTTTWRSEIFNTGGSAISAQAQVECLKR